MYQRTGLKFGKEYIKVVYCYPAYFTSMQSTSCEMLGRMSHELESRLPGEISTISDVQICHSNGRKQRGTKKPLDEGERGKLKKAGLRFNIRKIKIMASDSIIS